MKGFYDLYKPLQVAAGFDDATKPIIDSKGNVVVGGQASEKAKARAAELARDLGKTVADPKLDDHIGQLFKKH